METGNNVAYASDYYPFGESIREVQVGTKGGKYKFTEKERDAESSYDYFGARYYNNKLGVWLSADPKSYKYPSFSPYVYSLNNPINLYDPDGEIPWNLIVNGGILTGTMSPSRLHPVKHVYKPHWGTDISAAKGTDFRIQNKSFLSRKKL